MATKIPINTQELAVKVLRQVDGMREDRKHCDFLIKVGSEEIPAHRNILSATSDYFDAMFRHPTEENKSGVVVMMGVDPECAVICVDHMYGKEVSILPMKYEPLIYVATLMQLHTLRDAIATLLAVNLDQKSFFTARRIADTYGCKKLQDKCCKFAEENFGLISKEEQFGELDQTFIAKVIRSKTVKKSDEKLGGLIRWIKYDSERSKFMTELTQRINLTGVAVGYRRYLMENEPIISQNLELYKIFSVSVMDTMKVVAKDKRLSDWQSDDEDSEMVIAVFDKTSGFLQCFNPRDNAWKRMQPLDDDMKQIHFSVVLLDDHIYALMENKKVLRLQHSDERASWTNLPDMLDQHGWYPPAAVLDGSIYVIGGHHDVSTKAVEMYHPTTNQWVKLQDRPHCSKKFAMTASEGFIYCFGGLLNHCHLNNAERFDPSESTWIQLPPMHEVKRSSTAVGIGHRLFVIGGYVNANGGYVGSNGERRLDSLECYDTVSNQWSILSRMCAARQLAMSVAINGIIYVLSREATSNGIQKYDVEKDEWKMIEIPAPMRLEILGSTKIKLP